MIDFASNKSAPTRLKFKLTLCSTHHISINTLLARLFVASITLMLLFYIPYADDLYMFS